MAKNEYFIKVDLKFSQQQPKTETYFINEESGEKAYKSLCKAIQDSYHNNSLATRQLMGITLVDIRRL